MNRKALRRILSEFPWLWAISATWNAKNDEVTIYRGGSPGEEKFRRFIFEMNAFCQEENKHQYREFKIFIKYDHYDEGVVMITPTKGMPLFLGYYDSFFKNASPGLFNAHYACIMWVGVIHDGKMVSNERRFMIFPLPQNWQEIAKSAFDAC
jgi:hypothetical protein